MLGELAGNDIARRMREWRLLLLPSYTEGHPIVGVEACACRLPVAAVEGVLPAELEGRPAVAVRRGSATRSSSRACSPPIAAHRQTPGVRSHEDAVAEWDALLEALPAWSMRASPPVSRFVARDGFAHPARWREPCCGDVTEEGVCRSPPGSRYVCGVASFREHAKDMTKRLGFYEHIALARQKRVPDLSSVRRNERDDRHLAAILAAVLRPDSAAVDVGANVGGVLREIVRLAPHGRHLAFEPIPQLAQRLAHEYPAVDVHAAAAADRTGKTTFQWIESEPAMSGLQLPAKHAALGSTAIEVQLERLDDVVAEPPTFVKIDVEGGEEAVLRGAQETLERHRPLVALEHGLAAAAFGTTTEVIYDLLTDPGLRIFDMDGHGPLGRGEFVELVGIGDHFNFIAH